MALLRLLVEPLCAEGSVQEFGGGLGPLALVNDGAQRGDHLPGIGGAPDVAPSRHAVAAGLDD
jgi:hypothetical protein